jgi:pyruvate dehydrogenase E2 component (dihydrolipoamide acetyltransferase)
MALVEIQVPDIGDFDEVGVIELLVKPGDTVKAEQSLITVESDKASMEIPSSHAGVVKDLRVQVGDKVKQGSVVLTLEVVGAVSESNSTPAQSQQAQAAIEKIAKTPTPSAAPVAAPAPDAAAPVGPIEVRVPDIGDFKDVAVIELLVKPGDTVKLEQSLFTVESDKASMEIPSPAAGVIKELKVKIGDTVNIGDLVAVLEGSAGNAPAAVAPAAPAASAAPVPAAAVAAAAPPSNRYRLCLRARAPARHARCRPATRQPLGAQIRPRTRCAARRSQGHWPQGSHHARRHPGFHQGGDGRRHANQGAGSQGTRRQ